jgi:hypothetical protein
MMLRRHPLVIYLNAIVAASGVAYFFGPPPGSVATLLPGGLASLWYGSLALGGATGLVSAAWPDALTGVLIERAAMWPLGMATLAYSVALVALAHLVALFTAGLVAGFGVAAILRALQITRELRSVRAASRE